MPASGGERSKENIHYATPELADYFSRHRNQWDDFYPSEKWMFTRVAGPEKYFGRVLDVGCARGGLGRALAGRFGVTEYLGVDINRQVIELARDQKDFPVPRYRFECGDILEMGGSIEGQFDAVFSLSCADWNVKTIDIINTCWQYVRVGGYFLLTLRLTPGASITDLSKSFQYIYAGERLPDNKEALEKAPYVVLNVRETWQIMAHLRPLPGQILAYGYWGKPSLTAVTGYDRLVFTALALQKGAREGEAHDIACELHLPLELLL